MYLYADGHAVCWYEKRHKKAGTIEWMEVHEDIGIKCHFDTGRLIINGDSVPFLTNVAHIEMHRGVECGSDNSRERGLFIEIIHLRTKDQRYKGLSLLGLPDVLNSEIYWNKNSGTFQQSTESRLSWNGTRVTKIHYKDGKVDQYMY
jgi:hypothetical protein